MNIASTALVAAGIAYLVGSLPFGYLVAKFFKGTDIRTQGSGNIGATNIARTFGLKWGILVFVLDAVKGFAPVWLLPLLLLGADEQDRWQLHFEVLCGVATVLGHIFPVWLKFRGGKGVATSAGVVLRISPLATLIAILVYVGMVAWKRISSLGSLTGAAAFSAAHFLILAFQGKSPWDSAELSRTLFAALMPIVIIVSHRKNLGRLLRGEEPKFGSGKSEKPGAEPIPKGEAGEITREEQESA